MKSGMFEGVARLISGMNEETFPLVVTDDASCTNDEVYHQVSVAS